VKAFFRHPFVLAILATWAVYIVLLLCLPDDHFAAWRNQVAWPARSYLTVAQSGVLPFLGHAIFGTVGALLLQWPIGVLAGKLAGDKVESVVRTVILALFPLAFFAWVKAVPVLVTRIEGTTLVVREFDEWTRWPEPTRVIPAGDIEALDLFLSRHPRDDRRLVALAAITRAHGAVKLGERECRSAEACLVEADADLVALAARLGLATDGQPRADLRKDHHLLLVRQR
jgi:hypothetical protein